MFTETNRLILRDYTLSDLHNYYLLKSCNEVWRYSTCESITDRSLIKNQLEKLLEKQSKNNIGFCALMEKTSNQYIGEAGILSPNSNVNKCVLGYNLLPPFWNNGYATEITKELVRYAFEELKMERVEALAIKENIASCKVLENAGLLREGTLRRYTMIHDIYYDVCFFGMLKEEFFKWEKMQ